MKNKSSMFALFISKFFPPILNFIVFVYSARILDPESFGEVALALTLIFLVSSFLPTGWRDNLFKSEYITSEMISTVIWFHVLMSIVLVSLLLLFFYFFEFYFYTETINNMVMLLFVKVLFDCFVNVYNTLCVKYEYYFQLAIRTVICTLSSAITVYVMLQLDFGVWALVCSQIIISLFGFIFLYIKFRDQTLLYFRFEIIKDMYQFSMPVTFVNGFTNLFIQAESFIVGSFLGVKELGFFNLSKRLYDIIVDIFISTINEVSLSKISKNINDVKVDKSNEFIKLTAVTWWLMLPLIFLAYYFSEPMFNILFTNKWIESIKIFNFFCIIALIVSLGVPQRNFIILLGGARHLSKIQVCVATISIPIYMTLASYNMEYFLYSLVFFKFVNYMSSLILVRRFICFSTSSYFKVLFNSTLSLILANFLCEFLFTGFIHNIYIYIVIYSLSLIAFYIGFLEFFSRRFKIIPSIGNFTFLTIIK
ncbi:oligosaccharide flippase family protein [Shewanella sp. H8]|uniref:oligosaccharide flippase family protein n=1 Tax=Shewanella sp. H8 TaxID=3342676 RepID=UPI0033162618